MAVCVLTILFVQPTHGQESQSLGATTKVSSTPIVDTHVHLWDTKRPDGIYWIKKDDRTLYRNMLPEFHAPIARANGVRAVVVVQAGQSLPDNQWNLDITKDHSDLYRGVVGNLSEVIGTERFRPLFDQLCRDPRYVGYRLSGKYQDGLSDELMRDLKYTAEKGRTVDVLVGGYTLSDVQKIARAVPNLKLILDHFGSVRLSDSPLEKDWIDRFRETSRSPNVYCKVSALFGRFETQPAPTTIAAYRQILDLAVECFGADRLIFGSDWPVTRKTAEYKTILRLLNEYLADKDQQFIDKLYFHNARKFYGVTLAQ